MAYDRPTKTEREPVNNRPPDPALIVTDGVLAWMYKRKQSTLPSPCPSDPARCVRWWLDTMQEPEGPGETTLAPVAGADGQRWNEGYAQRCRNALLRFLDLSPMERSAVCAGVLEDRIPYRGDDFAFYRQVHEETMRMRAAGVGAYRQAIARKVSAYVDGMRATR